MEIVRVRAAASGANASRSVLAARLTPSVGAAVLCSPTVKSSPEASCTAPEVAKMATTPKSPFTLYDIAGLAHSVAIGDSNVGLGNPVLGRLDHLTVCGNLFATVGTPAGASASSRQPVIPPCPIDRRCRARLW